MTAKKPVETWINPNGEVKGKPLPEDYFSTGIFDTRRPTELFQCYTCEECGERLATWEHFKAHRDVCREREAPPHLNGH